MHIKLSIIFFHQRRLGMLQSNPSSPGSKEALAMSLSRKYVPLRPFSSLASAGYYGAPIGSVVFVSRFVSGGMTLARNRHDVYNGIVVLGAVGAYWKMVLSHDTRVVWNNRFVGGAMLGAIVYANVTP
jgi:hypothetical protein